ncbi:MAG: tetratricopeptide repeat protein [Pseudomonadota bacterium]
MVTPSDTPSPRAIASLELSKRGQLLIEANRPDEAIRYLERAINLYPGRGENYYYLAEAWLLKGNPSQAFEYNTLASIHFKDNPEWIKRIAFQKNIIDQLSKK